MTTSVILILEPKELSVSMGMSYSADETTYKIVEGGEHRSSTWGPEFREAYLWLFTEITSSTRSTVDNADLRIYPNPASTTLYISCPFNADGLDVRILDIMGAHVKTEKKVSRNQIDISYLPKGVYIIVITGSDITYSGKFVKK